MKKNQWATFTMLTPQAKTLVSIDVVNAWNRLGEEEFLRIVHSVLPDHMIATTVLTKDGFFQHLLITSTTDRKRKFRVKGGQQLICDQDAQTAAALFRRDVDALYHRKEFTL